MKKRYACALLSLLTVCSVPLWATTYPLTVDTYNYAGEKVTMTFQAPPKRVVAAYQDNIETLLALGCADKIVYAFGLDDPKVLSELQADFEKIPYSQSKPGKEAVMALNPDFITGWYSVFGEKNLGDVAFWKDRGVNTYMALNSGVRKGQNQTVEHELQDIDTLGAIMDKEDRAHELTERVRAEMKRIDDYLKGRDRKTAAVIEDEGGTYRVYGHQTLGGNVAERGGATLKPGAAGDPKKVGAEDLIAANPDALFLVWYEGFDLDGKDVTADEMVKHFTSDPKFAGLKAVKNGQVWPLNLSYVYCSGLRSGLGVELVARHLYPELYK